MTSGKAGASGLPAIARLAAGDLRSGTGYRHFRESATMRSWDPSRRHASADRGRYRSTAPARVEFGVADAALSFGFYSMANWCNARLVVAGRTADVVRFRRFAHARPDGRILRCAPRIRESWPGLRIWAAEARAAQAARPTRWPIGPVESVWRCAGLKLR